MTCRKTAILGAAMAAAAALIQAAPIAQPNIVIFLVDDMGLMDTSVPMLVDENGKPKKYELNNWYKTPGMERLAAQGIRFSDFYAQSVCSPSRASIMTGQNATRHATTTWINPGTNNRGTFGPTEWNWSGLKPGDVTLPLMLKESGYRTIHIGKAHFGPTGSAGSDPLNLGFDVNIGGAAWGRPESYFSEDHYGNHPKYKTMMKKGKPVKTIRAIPHLEKYYDTGTFLTEALTLEAKDQIRQAAAAGQPFFLNMAHYALHSPFDADPRFTPNYADSDKPARAQKFAALVEGMDKSLNDILDELIDLGVAQDTLILFLGDNGTDSPLGADHAIACSAPLKGKKATRYEGGIRVPFIAAWAQPDDTNRFQQKLPIARNAVQTQLGTIMDIYPTLLELTDTTNPADHAIDGSSLKKLFTGVKDDSRAEMFLMHFPHQHRSSYFTSFRLKNWKVIYHYNPETPTQPEYELYDLARDPSEENNQANSNPERLRSIMRAMKAQLEKEGALYPQSKDGTPLKPILP